MTAPARPVPAWRWLLSAALLVAAVALAVFLLLMATIATCGISGCSGGGFGVSYGTWYEVLGPLAVGGLALAIALATFPWSRPGLRWIVALGVAGIYVVSFGVGLLSRIPQWGF